MLICYGCGAVYDNLKRFKKHIKRCADKRRNYSLKAKKGKYAK